MGNKNVIGLSSGTSADGVDAAVIRIKSSGLKTRVTLIDFETYPYPAGIKKEILAASSPKTSRVDHICSLNFQIGEIFAKAALKIIKKSRLKKSDVSLIGSHGQTIYHIPPGTAQKKMRPSTLQIGEPSLIAEITGITTVADFRPRDIAAGGMGAPLTPYVHFLLLGDKKEDRAVLNIGGISNITVIPKQYHIDKVTAFDTGPGNMVIDGVVSIITGQKKKYDNRGKMASRGTANKKLLSLLMRHPYIKKPPPKSTGREEFGNILIDKVLKFAKREKLKNEDLLRTVTEFTAESILFNMKRFVLKKVDLRRMIVGGGGAKNLTLLSLLKAGLPELSVETMEEHHYSSDAFEAVSFAILANETISGVPGNLPRVTGARKKAVLGKIIPGRI